MTTQIKTCTHHWVINEFQQGECKKCGVKQQFLSNLDIDILRQSKINREYAEIIEKGVKDEVL